MWELECEESWVLKNWSFWTVVLVKTLESPLDCKEIQPVHSTGHQPWVFFGRSDAKAETPLLCHLMWRVDSLERTLMMGRIVDRRKGDDGGWDGWMASPTQWTWVWVNSGRWWWTGRPGMLRFNGWQRISHNWVNDLIWSDLTCIQISQEAGHEVWYAHLFKNFPPFVVIHTAKVNTAEIDIFMELSSFFDDPTDVGYLISGSSSFSKFSLNIWKFTVHILLKPGLENFEHYFTSVQDECNCVVVWDFPGGSDGKASVCNAGDLVSIPGQEDILEKEMAIHSSTIAWKIPWTEEPGGLQSMGLLRVGHD